MTDVIDAPGIGHNQPDPMEMEKKHQKWDRWAKKRTFVRALWPALTGFLVTPSHKATALSP